jgi:hypothetical protein
MGKQSLNMASYLSITFIDLFARLAFGIQNENQGALDSAVLSASRLGNLPPQVPKVTGMMPFRRLTPARLPSTIW